MDGLSSRPYLVNVSRASGGTSRCSATSPMNRTPLRVKVRIKPLRSAIVANRPAYRVDPRRYRRFRDDPSVPNRLQQIILADHPMAVPYEESEQIKGLRFEVDRFRHRGAIRGGRYRAENRQTTRTKPAPVFADPLLTEIVSPS